MTNRRVNTGKGRGSSPNSLNALTHKGKGRTLLPKGQGRDERSLSIKNDAWNGLLRLAKAANMSVARLSDLFGKSADVFQGEIGNLISAEMMMKLNLTPSQILDLSLLDTILQVREVKSSKTERKQRGKELPNGSNKEQHNLTFSSVGWEGLQAIAKQYELSPSAFLDLIGENYVALLLPLHDLTGNKALKLLDKTPTQLLEMSVVDFLQQIPGDLINLLQG